MKTKIISLSVFLITLIPFVSIYSQTFQCGIFNPSENTLSVKLKPSANANGFISFLQFTILWQSSYGVTLGDPSGSYALDVFQTGTVNISGTNYNYAIYAASSNANINWLAGSENIVMNVDVNQDGIGVGTFSLAENGEVVGGDFGIELSGSDVTNHVTPLYQPDAMNVPLPVELTSFTASVNNEVVNLKWQTATEVNNFGFDIEKRVSSQQSAVSSDWEKIGFIKGAGNSSSPKNYSFTDKNLTGGTKFKYRLKQIDTDGKFEYSNEEEVEIIPLEYSLSQNYPNPFNPITSIKFELPKAAKVTLNVYNILGEQVVNLVNENLEAGFHSVPFNASELPSGTYIYRLQADKFVQTKKMILLK